MCVIITIYNIFLIIFNRHFDSSDNKTDMCNNKKFYDYFLGYYLISKFMVVTLL